MTQDEKKFWAAQRGLSIEDYTDFLEAASDRYLEQVSDYPDAAIPLDQDVALFLNLEIFGQEVTARELAQFDGSSTDAGLHEQEA